MNADIAEYGFDVVPEAVAAETLRSLITAFESAPHALRDLMGEIPQVARLCRSQPIRDLVEPVLGPACFAVRGIFFDKTARANWKVPWHQDLTIAVRERIEVPAFGPWSEKAGIPHVQPPPGLLARMLTIRLHLDPCGAANGPLKVLPGTHRFGRLEPAEIARFRETISETACLAQAGAAVRMRPLLLHASSPAETPNHRRVLHLEFAAEELPGGLEWHGCW